MCNNYDMPTKQTLAIIIPCYNEEQSIGGCLQSIAEQTERPDEVIVVDNNCTDRTIEIAKRFDFVKVIRESKQGIIPARNAGFAAAKSSLLGRIDAEAVLTSEWVEIAKQSFSDDHSLGGLTGLAETSRLPYTLWMRTTIGSRLYLLWARRFFGVPVMWGSNMVVSRKSWLDVRSETCDDDSVVHEDQDLSLCLWEVGYEIVQDNSLLQKINGGTYFDFDKQTDYWRRAHDTKELHRTRISKLMIDSNQSVFLTILLKLFTPVAVAIIRLFGYVTMLISRSANNKKVDTL